MAMLAEKRTKTRYLLHSSKTNAKWAEDEGNMGRKLLSKMGWQPGKGLGVNENGRVDPLFVKFKNDFQGLGSTRVSEADIAVGQQKDFDALLSTLSTEIENVEHQPVTPEDKTNSSRRSPASLELQSQKSRARVHYHKFTRGKDLSRASSKDLASILGISTPPATPEVIVPDVGPVLELTQLKSSGTSADYFAEKLKKRKINAEILGNSSNNERSRDNEDAENEDSSGETVSGLDSAVSNKGRRKSVTWGEVEVSFVSKYIKDMGDTSTESVNEDASEETESAEVCDDAKKKKKKKKRTREENTSLLEDAPNESEINEKVEDQIDQPKKKKKKLKEEEPNLDELPNDLGANEICNAQINNVKGKKRKKDKSISLGESSSDTKADEINGIQLCELDDAESDSNLKRKRKKKSKSSCGESDLNGAICTNLDVSHVEVSEIVETTSSRKKHKKNKKDDSEGENIADQASGVQHHEVYEISVAENTPCQKLKKKSNKKSTDLVNSPLASSAIGQTQNENTNASASPTVSKSKKVQSLSGEDATSLSDTKEDDISSNDSKVDDIFIVAFDLLQKLKKENKKQRKKGRAVNNASEIQQVIEWLNEMSDKLNTIVNGSSSEATLSTLMQDRMAKWKERINQDKEREKLEQIETVTVAQSQSGEDTTSLSDTKEDDMLEVAFGLLQKLKKKMKKKRSKEKKKVCKEIAAEESSKVELESECLDEMSDKSNATVNGSHSEPTLSALTQERMAKWKDRSKNKDKEEKKSKQVEIPAVTLVVKDPHIAVQDYTYKKVLSIIDPDMRKVVNKRVIVTMPPTNFRGSNLDSLEGYGKR